MPDNIWILSRRRGWFTQAWHFKVVCSFSLFEYEITWLLSKYNRTTCSQHSKFPWLDQSIGGVQDTFHHTACITVHIQYYTFKNTQFMFSRISWPWSSQEIIELGPVHPRFHTILMDSWSSGKLHVHPASCVLLCVLCIVCCFSQPSECGQQRTLNIVHAQTAAQQQSNGSYEARMSGK